MKEKRSMFTNNEIPLKDFEKAGLDIGKMPADMLSSLMKGEISQVMEIRPVLKSGRKEALPVKLRLTRDEDNHVVLMAYPVHRDIVNNLRLGEQEQQQNFEQAKTIKAQEERIKELEAELRLVRRNNSIMGINRIKRMFIRLTN